MKKYILIILGLLVFSCTSNPNYESNLALAKKWVEAFETSNIDLWKEVVSEDLVDIAPMYGMGQVDYNSSLQVSEFYVQNYTDVKFNNQVWLPGIDTLTMKPDGSVRAYGTWTGKSKSTGRDFTLTAYHNFDFKDGKIVSTGEYFDASGMVNSVGPIQKSLVVVASHIKPGKIDEYQALIDSEAGLKTTRNYKGCISVEATYNEASNMYFIIENWESAELYQEYLNWRLNEDTSGLVSKIAPLLVGGQSGMSVYNPNTRYRFY
tara:strand:- start:302 stop:1090 length:789 start_codon:yes stop_codon:yes gene_type:complete